MQAEDNTKESLIEALAEAQRHIDRLEAGLAEAAREQQRLVETQAAHLALLNEQLQQEKYSRLQAESALQQAHNQLGLHLDELAVLNLVAQTLISITDLPVALVVVSETVTHLLAGHDTAVMLLIETEPGVRLLARYSDQLDDPAIDSGMLLPELKAQLVQIKQTIVIPSDPSDPRLERLQTLGLACLMVTPLLARGEVIGAIQVTAAQPGRTFHRTEVALVETIASQVVGTIETTRLFAEERRLEEQLRQSQKMQALGQLAGGVAHHFNNMLTSIVGFVSFAIEALPDQPQARQDLERVLSIARHAANLIHQLLTFTRTQPVQLNITDLNSLILKMEETIQRTIGQKVQLITHLAPDLELTEVNPQQFEQLLANLVSNAQAAMPEGGILILETGNIKLVAPEVSSPEIVPPGNYIRLRVIDTGVGMMKEIQARIFEPFFTTKEVGQGPGLGLSTCFGIMKQHEGYITVESAPSQGSTFSLYFPQVPVEMDLLPVTGGQIYPSACQYSGS